MSPPPSAARAGMLPLDAAALPDQSRRLLSFVAMVPFRIHGSGGPFATFLSRNVQSLFMQIVGFQTYFTDLLKNRMDSVCKSIILKEKH